MSLRPPRLAVAPLLVGGALLVLTSTPARAQGASRALSAAVPPTAPQPKPAATPQADPGSGIWWSVGLGAGAARFTCDLCARGRDTGPLLRVAVGSEARPGLRVGVTGGGWTHVDADVRETIYQAGLLAKLEVSRGSRLHVIGGLSWSGYRADEFAYDAASLSLGAGLDFPITGPWVVSNDLVLDAASFGRLRNDGELAARDVALSVLRLEVSLVRR
ncbi:MAG TPA: hypothetical protein VLL48_07840 [Longimicrobiales bacterium]|nr:hypothetical protein [Longimicrobiales bacterium]